MGSIKQKRGAQQSTSLATSTSPQQCPPLSPVLALIPLGVLQEGEEVGGYSVRAEAWTQWASVIYHLRLC